MRLHHLQKASTLKAGIAGAVALFGLAQPALAESNRAAIGLHAGTLGVGADIQVRTTDWLVLRGGGHFADVNIDRTFDDIDYDGDVGLTNGYVTADIHPFANGFFLSGGVILGDKTIDLTTTPSTPVEIGDVVFSPAEIGTLVGRVEGRSAAPFAGLGFDNAVTSDNQVGFSLLLGVAFTGEPTVDLEAVDGLLASDPTFLAELAEEEERLRQDARDFRFYPVARIGLTIGF